MATGLTGAPGVFAVLPVVMESALAQETAQIQLQPTVASLAVVL